MRNNFLRVYKKYEDMKSEKKVTMRDAALVLSLERLYEAMKARGWL